MKLQSSKAKDVYNQDSTKRSEGTLKRCLLAELYGSQTALCFLTFIFAKCTLMTTRYHMCYSQQDWMQQDIVAELSMYNFAIRYRSGKTNCDADGLSRSTINQDAIQTVCQMAKVEAPSLMEISCIKQQALTCSPELLEGNIQRKHDWKTLHEYDKVISNMKEKCEGRTS